MRKISSMFCHKITDFHLFIASSDRKKIMRNKK